MGKIIGIDLGTTNSCVAVFEGNEPGLLVGVVVAIARSTEVGSIAEIEGRRKHVADAVYLFTEQFAVGNIETVNLR